MHVTKRSKRVRITVGACIADVSIYANVYRVFPLNIDVRFAGLHGL